METTRFILLIALGLVLTMLWQAWQEDYGVAANNNEVTVNDTATVARDEADVPSLPDANQQQSSSLMPALVADNEQGNRQGETVSVKTDVLDIEINTRGATIERLYLLNYPVDKGEKNNPVKLLKNESNEFYWVQSGILSRESAANHKSLFQSEKNEYVLTGDSLDVRFESTTEEGLRVIKTYTFKKGSYLAELRHEVFNETGQPWTGSAYAQINRTDPAQAGSRLLYTYTGAVLHSPDKRYEKISFDDIRDENITDEFKNGWVAMLQHYFFTALLPSSPEETYRYYTLNPDKKSYVIGAVTPGKTVAVGSSETFHQRVYFGPKLQKSLDKIADGLELTVDYGIFWFIAKPLYWVLDHLHTYTNNWGWSIVLVTLLLKLVFYRLSAAGYRSMANMRRVQPRLVAIKERYKNDRARLNQAMMDIYKQEKINPLGGCFPILIQIPVFISLYWVLLESVELRQAPFALWLDDLSSPDPFFVLPLLMGVTMFIQQKLNPAPMDPVQEKVMQILPIVFTVFFAFFPSGLVLYWVVNNILSIAQQWMITRNLEKAGLK